jgi:hypothetical protein
VAAKYRGKTIGNRPGNAVFEKRQGRGDCTIVNMSMRNEDMINVFVAFFRLLRGNAALKKLSCRVCLSEL